MIIGISGKIGSGKDLIGRIILGLKAGLSTEEILKLTKNDLWWLEDKLSLEDKSSFEIKKFADKLKDIVCLLIGCTREQLEDREFKEKELGEEWDRVISSDGKVYLPDEYPDLEYSKMTPRLLLQLLGTNCGRDIIHPNVWVNALMNEYKPIDCKCNEPDFCGSPGNCEELAIYPHWIITDLRFPNEAKAIKNKGGIVIRVNRLIGKNVYVIENEQPFQNWCGVIESYNGNNFYNVINNDNDVVLVHENQITLLDEHESETALDDYQDWDYVIENDGTVEDLIEKVKEIYGTIDK